MNLLSRFYLLCLFGLVLAGCANVVTTVKGSTLSDSTPDSDAAQLITMSEQAMQIAQKESPDVALRQVDSDLRITDFRFVDKTMTKEIMVVIPEANAPINRWHTNVNSVSPLLTPGPAINLQSLKVGPNRVAQAITAYWPGCVIKGMNLYRENDQLTWVVFCNTPKGIVSGSMDNQSGIFIPSDSLPAAVPLTATPVH
jgi:hypothetical protein